MIDRKSIYNEFGLPKELIEKLEKDKKQFDKDYEEYNKMCGNVEDK